MGNLILLNSSALGESSIASSSSSLSIPTRPERTCDLLVFSAPCLSEELLLFSEESVLLPPSSVLTLNLSLEGTIVFAVSAVVVGAFTTFGLLNGFWRSARCLFAAEELLTENLALDIGATFSC